jgi:autotransporter-associated beta strand protein
MSHALRQRSLFAAMPAGGVIALLQLSATPAFATCFTFQGGSATTTLRCFTNTTTGAAPFTNTNPNNPSTNSVIQVFNSNIAVNIDKGVTVDGLGFSIQTEGTGHNIAVTNAGFLHTTGTLFGALFATTDGPITYVGNGRISGLSFVTTGTGGIQIGTAAVPITWLDNSPGSAVSAVTKTGDIGVFLSGGTMTGTTNGMFLQSDVAGKIDVSLTGHTAINSDSPRAAGIFVQTAGAINISSDADIGGVNHRITQGILTHSIDGSTSVIQAGNIFANTLGISAINSGTSGNINVTLNGAVSVVGGIGVAATIIGANAENVTVHHNGTVNTSAGSGAETGIFATTLGSGNVFVDVRGNVSTSSDTRSTGIAAAATTGNVTIDIASGATVSAGGTAIVAGAARGATIFNAGTISGAAAAIQFGGAGNTLTLAPGSAINGKVLGTGSDTLQLGGGGIDTFDASLIGSGKQYLGFTTLNKLGSSNWTLTGTSTYTGATNVNAGTLAVNGSIANSAVTVDAGGTLGGNGTVGNTTINGGTLAPGNSIGTLTVQGNLVFTTAASYMVEVSPANADRTNVAGTATLGGATVKTSFAPGTYVAKQYTILDATGGVSGTFNTLANTNLPDNFKSSLSYDANNVYLNLALNFIPPPGSGLNANQQNVANAIVGFFNSNHGIPLVFGGLTPAGLAQISGEAATGSQQTTFNAMNQFMGVMTDPFIAGRGDPVTSSTGAPQFAEESDPAIAYASDGKPRTKSEREAYAAVYRKAPVMADTSTQRWGVWAAGYGGSQTTDGNTALGSNNTRSSLGGVAVGADYRFSPYTLAGFALAGGGTSFSVIGQGTGRSDLFQVGAFVRHNVGAAYLTGAVAYGWQDVTTDRTVTVAVAGADLLRAKFNANAWSGRVEGGYRFVTPWMAVGLTPYAAGQFTTFDLPGYAEQAIAGANTFALNYAAKDVTASRSELGLRSDKSFAMQNGIFTLRGRAAWAHNFNTDRNIGATFQTLPGASFVVNGAAQAHDSALATASAEMKWLNGFSLAATFEGEFSNVTRSYAGKGVARYSW